LSIRDHGILGWFLRRRRRWKIIISLCVLGVLATIAAAVAMMTAEEPPVGAYDRARIAVSHARKAGAGQFAPNILRGAESRLEEARFAWQMENLRWSPRRNFTKTRKLSLDVIRRAQLAERRGIAVRDSLKSFSSSRISQVGSEIQAFWSYYDDVPIKGSLRRNVVKGEVLYKESRSAFNRGDYIKATAKIQEASRLIDHAATSSEKFLEDYMANLSQWRQWARETVAWSASTGGVAIVVDKMGRSCKVYRSGRLSAEYPVELGANWIGDKQSRGDKATPEGRYHVRRKKGAGNTKYHRALEIDYPNEADLKWFREAKRRGQISAGARIGGVIEIHGEGGRGENWTEGCVALRNDHMDRVFEVAGVGTPVTIVGALDSNALAKNGHARNGNGH
jgi:L,D-peptidoglycan transpeptidase YkuD (ErfK/YbiS/YcfS/YnhG family)